MSGAFWLFLFVVFFGSVGVAATFGYWMGGRDEARRFLREKTKEIISND